MSTSDVWILVSCVIGLLSLALGIVNTCAIRQHRDYLENEHTR